VVQFCCFDSDDDDFVDHRRRTNNHSIKLIVVVRGEMRTKGIDLQEIQVIGIKSADVSRFGRGQ
jgi:primosomal protein N'